MLQVRYKKMKSSTCANQDQVSNEISILQKLSIHNKKEKAHIPGYLQYQDEGYMYFPCTELLPFLKAVDIKTKEHANSERFMELGADLLTTVSNLVENSSDLQALFTAAVLTKAPEVTALPVNQLNNVFKELCRKLCHTRVQEFLDSFKQSTASKQGSATLSELNLRDTLLSHHVNIKSKLQ